MYVEILFPEVKEPSAAIFAHGVYRYFMGSAYENAEVDALVRTYLRLVESSVLEYTAAGAALRRYWSLENGADLRPANRAVSHFENCVSCMHRAIRVYRRLKAHRAQEPISAYLATERPAFAKESVANQIRNLRDEVHHTEERLVNGEYAQGHPVALRPNGPEIPHPVEVGQTIQIVDRIEIGAQQVSFENIATWLREMIATAERVAAYRSDKKSSVVQCERSGT